MWPAPDRAGGRGQVAAAVHDVVRGGAVGQPRLNGYAELLADGAIGELTGDQLGVVARIDRNGMRLIRLVEDLLTLSRLEASALVIRRSPTELGQLVREVGLLLEEQLRARSLDLRLYLPDVPVVMHVDSHELERVPVNLMGNSIKFTPDGGRIDVTLGAEADQAVITVADTGLGIAPTSRHSCSAGSSAPPRPPTTPSRARASGSRSCMRS